MTDQPPGSKPTYGSAIRIGQIIHWLHESALGVSLRELRERLGISERTLFRYIQTLRENLCGEDGEPLVEVVKGIRHGRLRFRQRKLEMRGSAYELMSLYLALDLMTFMDGTFFHHGAQEVLERLEQMLLKTHGNETNLILKDFHKKFFHWTEAPKDYSEHNEILEKVVRALVMQRQIEISYQAPGKPARTHGLYPLTLLMYKRALYLVAHKEVESEGKGKMREITFAVERIKDARVLDDGFFYPYDYDPQKRFQSTFGLVREAEPVAIHLRFSQVVAANVASRRWHPTQETRPLPSGELDMTLYTETGAELLSWILGYGPFVQVIGPPTLKAKIADRLREALARYDAVPGADSGS